jgi:uncharacterized membrane protein
MAARSRSGSDRMLLHPPMVSIGGSLLIAAFFTDWEYSRTSLFQWANFSAWLITGGLIFALAAALLLVIDLVLGNGGRIRWAEFVLLGVAAVLSIFNVLIHSRDAWTSVVPEGIVLSAVSAILLLIVAFRGWRVTAERFAAEGERP